MHRLIVHGAWLGALFAVVACGSSSDPPAPDSDAGVVADAGKEAAVDASSNAVSCTGDTDCRTFEFTCDGCYCRALALGEPEPTCNEPPVSCFAPACKGKVAVCEGGQCKVVAAP